MAAKVEETPNRRGSIQLTQATHIVAVLQALLLLRGKSFFAMAHKFRIILLSFVIRYASNLLVFINFIEF